ncbi:ABC transporter substrate-binding protein [Sulfuricaulis limicola]|uniref:ABC transporter substrate-binding protein n=2 Tax=Sulfuricaulis limicola TaxID=1620215 RepID=A0A1B4XHY1_9GAMM|nr:ABC transporter substrate-binding protein [Sulfuricaulis limicola]
MTGCSTVRPESAPGVAILLSDRSPAFVGVQREIEKRVSQRIENYYLGGSEASNSAAQKKIQSSEISQVVAIGLPAARAARGLSGKRVVFCQVFNYEDTDLVTAWMKGVAATTPVDEQFRVWKQLSPRLKKVGVITGKNLHGLMEEARAAAHENGLELVHVEVRSDKETLYAYKQLVPKIQGLWLVPDNRVLSREVIRDVMAHSVREGKQVAVFSHQLLALGGLVSAESGYADIAEQVLERLKQTYRDTDAPIAPLTRATIRINSVMARRLNLTLPRPLQGLAHAP